MKALILAGGRGSRLQTLTENTNKPMHQFKGHHLIEYSLESARRAGVNEIVIVVSYKAELIINRFGNNFKGTPVKYVIQWKRQGLVHAIECSEPVIDGSDFILFLADEVLVDPRHAEMAEYFRYQSVFALCGTVWVEDTAQIKKTYAVIYNEQNNQIYRLIEKPRKPLNNLMGTGNCIFKNAIFEHIPETPINQRRGEKELPDLIQCAIDGGKLVKFFDIGGKYININTLDDVEGLEKLSPTTVLVSELPIPTIVPGKEGSKF
jgi:dTDP-glucose pyrophosphorylase